MAEFKEIVRIETRMCENRACADCRLSIQNNGHNTTCKSFKKYFPEEYERICLEWTKENSEITNKDKLNQLVKEAFGKEFASKFIPLEFCNQIACNCECKDCQLKNFWNKPYIEQERKNEQISYCRCWL